MHKKIILAITLIFFFYPIIAEQDLKVKGPGLEEKLKVMNQNNYPYPDKVKDVDDLLELVPELKQWMRENRYFDVTTLCEKLKETLSICWEMAVEKITKDPNLDSSLKEKILQNLEKQKLSMQFENPLVDPNNTTGSKYPYMAADNDCVRIQMNRDFPEGQGLYLKYIVQLLLSKFKNKDYDLNKAFYDQLALFISSLAHEMLHIWGDLKGTPGTDEGQKYECIVACLEFKLFGIVTRTLKNECDDWCAYLHSDCLEKAGCDKNKKHKNRFPIANQRLRHLPRGL